MFDEAAPVSGMPSRPSGGQSSHHPNSAIATPSWRLGSRLARNRAHPFAVCTLTQSPDAIPRSRAVFGLISIPGSGALRRSDATWRCELWTYHADFAVDI